MAAATRIYTVSDGNTDRLVRATHPSHALTHVARSAYTVRVATQAELERYARPPCLQCGAMTEDEATSRCMGSRAEGGCHGNDLWP